MTSAKLAAVGAMIGIVLLLWWLSSLGERLAQIEKALSVVHIEQQQLQTVLAREKSIEDLRARLDLLETRLLSEMGDMADQFASRADRLVTQLSILESRIDTLQDQLDIIESLVEGGEAGQTAGEGEITGRQP